MNFLLITGYFLATITLIKIHIVVALLVVITGQALGLDWIFNCVAIIYLTISIIAHVKTTFEMFNKMNSHIVKSLENPIDIDETHSVKKTPMLVGFAWRFFQEWENMSKIASFNFKLNS